MGDVGVDTEDRNFTILENREAEIEINYTITAASLEKGARQGNSLAVQYVRRGSNKKHRTKARRGRNRSSVSLY